LGGSPAVVTLLDVPSLQKQASRHQNGAFRILYHCETTISSFQNSTCCGIPTSENHL